MIEKRYTKVYICHPYADDPDGNVEKVLNIVKGITESTKKLIENAENEDYCDEKRDSYYSRVEIIVPIAVHLLFPKFMSEDTFGREVAMEFCLQVLRSCKEIWVYGPRLTEGMRQEISVAGDLGITIVWKNFG